MQTTAVNVKPPINLCCTRLNINQCSVNLTSFTVHQIHKDKNYCGSDRQSVITGSRISFEQHAWIVRFAVLLR